MHPKHKTDLLYMMKAPSISSLALILIIIFSSSFAVSADDHDDFLECLSEQIRNYSSISSLVYTPANSSFSSVVDFSLWNSRFSSPSTPKPQVIITPDRESQVPPIVYCAKESDLEIRTRSGGHDYEGLSSVSRLPFVILDLIRLSEVTVDVEAKTAWVGGGTNLGTVYYRIAERSPVLGFSAGFCPTVGVGGHISGGGYGPLFRKYGLAADNVIDARIVVADGRILDRRSMGEDLFWALRGGGGASFGIIVAWKLQLVDIPERVTVFRAQRTLEQNATQIVHRWQYVAPTIDRDLYIGLIVTRVNSNQGRRNSTMSATFSSTFLGGIDRLLPLIREKFPELRLVREECTEMSWIQSVLFHAGFPIDSRELLLNRTQPKIYTKGKTDYVQKPIPESAFNDLWRYYFEREGQDSIAYFVPYGGRMDDIPESATPFNHRKGNLYMFANFAIWQEDEDRNSDRYLSWVRRVWGYLTPYVSENPRSTYLNYRDLDIGVNNIIGETSYTQASIWGTKYYGRNNFDRLVQVKTVTDPKNFFRNEQSIPPIHSKRTDEDD